LLKLWARMNLRLNLIWNNCKWNCIVIPMIWILKGKINGKYHGCSIRIYHAKFQSKVFKNRI
jgi:hypothetical protein